MQSLVRIQTPTQSQWFFLCVMGCLWMRCWNVDSKAHCSSAILGLSKEPSCVCSADRALAIRTLWGDPSNWCECERVYTQDRKDCFSHWKYCEPDLWSRSGDFVWKGGKALVGAEDVTQDPSIKTSILSHVPLASMPCDAL